MRKGIVILLWAVFAVAGLALHDAVAALGLNSVQLEAEEELGFFRRWGVSGSGRCENRS